MVEWENRNVWEGKGRKCADVKMNIILYKNICNNHTRHIDWLKRYLLSVSCLIFYLKKKWTKLDKFRGNFVQILKFCMSNALEKLNDTGTDR